MGSAWIKVPEFSGVASSPISLPHADVVTRWSRPIVADYMTLKVMWRLKFKSNFLGRHKIFMRGIDVHGGAYGGDTSWKWKGNVTVTP